MACAGLCDAVFDISVYCGIRLCASIATDFECQGTSLRPESKTLRTNRSVNEVPSRISAAIYGATSDQIQVLSLPRRRVEVSIRRGTAVVRWLFAVGVLCYA